MKKYQIKKSIHRLRNVSLSPEERAEVRVALASLVSAVPPASTHQVVGWHWNLAAAMLAVFSVVTFFSAGVSFAAEGALPGDILYPIKISITEPLRAKLASSAEARANWELERTERRLLEAEQLAAKAQLSALAGMRLSKAVDKHAHEADALADSLDDSGEHKYASEVRSKLEALLNVHSATNADADSSKPKRDEGRESFAEIITREATEARAARNRAEDSLTGKTPDRVESAATGARASAQTAIDQATLLVNQKSNLLSKDLLKKINEHLLEARELLTEADKKFGEDEFGEAFKKYTAALRASHEAQVMASTSLNIKINREQEKGNDETNKSSNNDTEDGERSREQYPNRVTTSSIEIKLNTGLDLQ